MIGYEVVIKGLDEQMKKLENFPRIAERRLVPAMEASLMMVEREAKKQAPVGVSGMLRSSIGGKITYAAGTDVRGVVGASAPYAAAVELGAKPHFPPVANIAYWVDRKLGVRDGFEVYGIALAIARNIARRGTRKQPFLKPAYEAKKAAILARFKLAADQAMQDLVWGR